MPKEIIRTPEAPQSPMYSQAVKAGNTIYVAGTTGIDVTTGHFAGTTVSRRLRGQPLPTAVGQRRRAPAGVGTAPAVRRPEHRQAVDPLMRAATVRPSVRLRRDIPRRATRHAPPG